MPYIILLNDGKEVNLEKINLTKCFNGSHDDCIKHFSENMAEIFFLPNIPTEQIISKETTEYEIILHNQNYITVKKNNNNNKENNSYTEICYKYENFVFYALLITLPQNSLVEKGFDFSKPFIENTNYTVNIPLPNRSLFNTILDRLIKEEVINSYSIEMEK